MTTASRDTSKEDAAAFGGTVSTTKRTTSTSSKRATATTTRADSASKRTSSSSKRTPSTAKRGASASKRGKQGMSRGRSAAKRGGKRSKSRDRSVWVRSLLALGIVLLFSVGFYLFFIRPYSYRWKPCYGMKGYGVCMPCSFEVHGIDISHYQGEIDWEELHHSQTADFPIRFIFMKATEGGDHGDDMFARNFNLARQYGFIRGAYHYFLPGTDAAKQADFFIRTVQLDEGDLPPVLDVETTGKSTPQMLMAGIKTWMDAVEAHYGVKPILYTPYKFKKRYLDDDFFDDYPYWIAHYYVDSVRYEGKWNFWQHTDAGVVPGIGEQVDLDVFNGSLEELRAMTLQPDVSL